MTKIASRAKCTLAAALLLGLPTGATAQDFAYGENLFATYCAACHGPTGAGDGSVSELFTQAPRNLQLLTADNGGTFPFTETLTAIDGRREIRAHGSNMPVWGDAFFAEGFEGTQPHPNTSPEDVAAIRIVALVYYLQTLQSE